MSYFVTVLALNGRRHKIPVKLNTPILMILEETCKKYKLNPDDYDLKYHKRILDLTSNIQFSGITNNAELELLAATKQRAETPVNIILQLENGERLAGSFPPPHTLWDIISELCSEEMKSKPNPVIIYTRQEVHGDKLKSTTLKMLGLTGGKALLRLFHRTEEQLKNQSVSAIYRLQPKPKPVEEMKLSSSPTPTMSPQPESSSNKSDITSDSSTPTMSPLSEKLPSSDKSSSSPVPENLTLDTNLNLGSPMVIETATDIPPETSPMDVVNEIAAKAEQSVVTHESSKSIEDDTPSTSDKASEVKMPERKESEFNIDSVEFIGERYALIFHVDSMPTPRFQTSEDDDFYELTIEDAKTLLRDIKRTRSELEEADLETSEARARKKSILLERTLSIYPYCVVRIIFPNRYVLQGVFQSTDCVLDVISFTKTFVIEFILSFYLYISPPKRILRAEETLLDIGAIPGINLYFGFDQADTRGNQFLKDEFLTRAVSPKIALEVANYFRRAGGMNTKPVLTPKPSPAADIVPPPRVEIPETERVVRKPASGKIPKWFKQV